MRLVDDRFVGPRGGTRATAADGQEAPKKRGPSITADELRQLGEASALEAARANFRRTARTFLQPQLNKAIKMINRHKKGYANPDFNPKDFIIFYKNQFYIESNSTIKDNTGKKIYNENTCFPTLEFPSDHAIISTLLIPIL